MQAWVLNQAVRRLKVASNYILLFSLLFRIIDRMPPPLFRTTEPSSSVIFGAPEGTDLERLILGASRIQMAIAFGHMSGWEEISPALISCKANVQILLGKSFLQTEPGLLYKLKALQSSDTRFKTQLAQLPASNRTFHPKIWIFATRGQKAAIVGSSNMSLGGISANVECNLFTSSSEAIAVMESWFEDEWRRSHPLEGRLFEEYVTSYNSIAPLRSTFEAKIANIEDTLSFGEAQWRKKDALEKARAYWRTDDGQKSVKKIESGVDDMRALLDFPSYDISEKDYRKFARSWQFGRVRFHIDETIAHLLDLKSALANRDKSGSFAELDKIPGVGPHIATKLLAVVDPDRFIVVNEPVKNALKSFGFSDGQLERLDQTKYNFVLKQLEPFLDEARALEMKPAAALDSFFKSQS